MPSSAGRSCQVVRPGRAVASRLWLPPVSRYLADWDRVRAERPVPYRRPESIFYGRLPRFR